MYCYLFLLILMLKFWPSETFNLMKNVRLKNEKKLLAEHEVKLLKNENGETIAEVKGTNVTHSVKITPQQAHCTCEWFTTYQGRRGICKHILATKILSTGMS